MRVTFTDSLAETRSAFLEPAKDTTALFYEVHAGTPNVELEALFDAGGTGEVFLRFDMSKHSEEARTLFLQLTDLERRAHALPATTTLSPE